jgi:MYXO-CTERM domain-containing protein
MSSGPTQPSFWKAPPVIAALAALVGVLVFEVVMARGGGEPGQAVLFLGRFHPLLVHLPIGIWVLVATAEAATFVPRWRPRIDPALGLALPLLLASTVTAYALGHFLGKAGGFPRGALTIHRRLELFATLGTGLCLLLWAYQTRRGTGGARWAYRGLLGLSIGLLSIGAHFGGTLTRGETYLAKYAPGFLKPFLGGGEPHQPEAKETPAAPSAEPLLHADVVQPLLRKYCVECHGPDKQKGKLRLDSLAELAKGGENGPVVKAGSSKDSSLVQRMLLPESDDDHMPPEGEPAPTADEIAVISFWIDRGANDTLRVRDLLVPDGARKILQNSIAPGSAREPEPAPARPSQPSAAPPASSEAKEAVAAPASDRQKDEPKAQEPAAPEAPAPEAAVASTATSGPEILAAKCSKCHGAKKQKGKLRVDSVAALLRGGSEGPAMVPGQPEKSTIIQRIKLPLGHDEHMPPPKEPQLDAAEVAALSAWVRRQSASRAPVPAPVAEKPSEAPSEPSVETPPAASETTTVTASTSAEPSDPRHAELLAELPATVRLYDGAVHPILMDKCAQCHGGAAPKADLDVSSLASLQKGGWSGPGVVASKPDDSLILQRAKLPENDDDRMPPPGSAPLRQGEVELIQAWVELGATPDASAETKTLSTAALEVLQETLGASGAKAGAAARVEPGAGGCAACTIGDTQRTPFEALGGALAAIGALLWRRRRHLTA